jgi:hypothetical protein
MSALGRAVLADNRVNDGDVVLTIRRLSSSNIAAVTAKNGVVACGTNN